MLVIFVMSLMLFGGKKLPELARSVGKSVREFKRAAAGVEEEIRKAMDAESPPVRPTPPARPKPPAASALPAAAAGTTVSPAADEKLDPLTDDYHHAYHDEHDDYDQYHKDHPEIDAPKVDEDFEAGDKTKDSKDDGAPEAPKKTP